LGRSKENLTRQLKETTNVPAGGPLAADGAAGRRVPVQTQPRQTSLEVYETRGKSGGDRDGLQVFRRLSSGATASLKVAVRAQCCANS
jgi:hypothetical protein